MLSLGRLVAARRSGSFLRTAVRSVGTSAPLRKALAADVVEVVEVDSVAAAGAAAWHAPKDLLTWRHIGVTPDEAGDMAKVCGADSLDTLIDETIPDHLRFTGLVEMPEPIGERAMLQEMTRVGGMNKVYRSFIGQGYSNTELPPVIKRNLVENPGWYTQYTPYQAEIAQGRLESLFNFQTMVSELTALPISNASLLDEPTAAAEAMGMCYVQARGKKPHFLVDSNTHPQTIALLRSRAGPLGIEVIVDDVANLDLTTGTACGVLLHYPGTDGGITDFEATAAKAKENGVLTVCASDLLSLTMLKAPGEFGADIAIGNSQRFGTPLGYGGPHAAFIACQKALARRLPGRIVGLTRDAQGKPAYRLALQTREQHIRRSKAVSNICTAQALLANVAAMYSVYHGPEGLKDIAGRVHGLAVEVASAAKAGGHTVRHDVFFDTVAIELAGTTADDVVARAAAQEMNLRKLDANTIAIAIDETTTSADVNELAELLGGSAILADGAESPSVIAGTGFERESKFLQQEVFNLYHSETEMMRYLKHLENKDVSLSHSMIPLGSCTMKLNAAIEMQGVTMSSFADMHPYAPLDQSEGYLTLFEETKQMLCDVTGYDDLSLQPNSGAQGELAGLMAIRGYHHSRGDHHRDICLVPSSAHGTNPASAVMAGMKVVDVKVGSDGKIDDADLQAKCEKHSDNLAAIMITYPSTYGVFEESVNSLCDLVHEHGGQVYLDGANMNAQVGLVRPGDVGADVSHLNLHKTFCIPHGGGGPGMGPIGVKAHLSPFLPKDPITAAGTDAAGDFAIAAAPYGSSLITTISWAYLRMMGVDGLVNASKYSILNANYMAARLAPHYRIRFVGTGGRVAHEFILDISEFKESTGVEAADIAKRLQDFGLHAPTVSWPLPNALMIEPTESESRRAMDEYCDALIEIRQEITEIAEGRYSKEDNVLANAPHSLVESLADKWDKPYPRSKAAYPLPHLVGTKMWPTVGRVDDVYGDKNLVTRLD
mmetsp:Transcript_32791/g.99136  ORF Transcript_32791/g.99136 Transcript_32791/m.99136 type:complete len:999 (+) Transcript_32791:861-3857(+)